MNTDDVLERLGLQTRKSPIDYLWPAMGVLGTGMVVGAGMALMFAPKAGTELRGDIGRTAKRVTRRVMPGKPRILDDVDSMTRDELYEAAKEMDIEGRSDMTKDQLASALRSA